MRIRTATVDDASGMARVHVDTWRTAYRDILPASVLSTLSYEHAFFKLDGVFIIFVFFKAIVWNFHFNSAKCINDIDEGVEIHLHIVVDRNFKQFFNVSIAAVVPPNAWAWVILSW